MLSIVEQVDVIDDVLHRITPNLSGNWECFIWLHQRIQALGKFDGCVEPALHVSVRYFIRSVGGLNAHSLAWIRKILDGQVDGAICGLADKFGLTLLGRLLYHFGRSMAVNSRMVFGRLMVVEARRHKWPNDAESATLPPQFQGRPLLIETVSLISDLVRGGSSLTSLAKMSRRSYTPLLQLITGTLEGFCDVVSYPNSERLINLAYSYSKSALDIWIRVLKNCGVDLETYGREEKKAHECLYRSKEWLCKDNFLEIYGLPWSHDGWWPKKKSVLVRLVNFDYGPDPSDWKFWFSLELESWFMDFWKMVEQPDPTMPSTMPGTWEEHDPIDSFFSTLR